MFLSRKALRKETQLFSVDFNQPWWYLIAQQKWLVLSIIVLYVPSYIFLYLTPFIIEYFFRLPSLKMGIFFLVLWILLECANVYARQLNARFQLQCIHSIYHSAHQHLLTIDPQYHVHRSSGAILGKIDRGARGYEELLDQIIFEFTPLLVGIVVMIVAVSKYSFILAGVLTAFFACIIFWGYYFARTTCHVWEKNYIDTDDSFRATAVENLSQVRLVRATFASDYMSNKLRKKIGRNMAAEGDLWLSYMTSSFIITMIYLTSVFVVLGVLAWQVKYGMTSVASALGLALAYTQSTSALQSITKRFRNYMRGWSTVTDLFSFIPSFGKQNYPVLGAGEIAVDAEVDTIRVKAEHISFHYETASIFDDHTLHITCPIDQSNKLYGIIGSSGSGKTTLLSILGGQLKPLAGAVTINDIDIYQVNDAIRRQLIALQGQIATTMRGTVKKNLLFGLPKTHPYDDHYLLSILERVGLREVLNAHQGLETMLGEGGLNLSGGQRQRLNFAGLYIRAHYYKPLLILIDEPTSSLDEVSEAAITDMIMELAQQAITLVIAHRLKTVEKAAGLIDFSLLAQEKNITIYTPEELRTHSAYYQALVSGTINFDS